MWHMKNVLTSKLCQDPNKTSTSEGQTNMRNVLIRFFFPGASPSQKRLVCFPRFLVLMTDIKAKRKKCTMWISQSTMQVKECKNGFRVPLMLFYERRYLPFPATKGEAVLSFHIHIPCQDECIHGEQVAVWVIGLEPLVIHREATCSLLMNQELIVRKAKYHFTANWGLKGFWYRMLCNTAFQKTHKYTYV